MLDTSAQASIIRIALSVLGPRGFALAGSGAIREHGLISRPTEDADFFAREISPAEFSASIIAFESALEEAGYSLVTVRQAELYYQGIAVKGEIGMQVDLGVDYRTYEPVILDIGAVIDVKDAIGNKVGAAFSRSEPRDFLDLDAIRLSEIYSDEELLTFARNNDTGFDARYLALSMKDFQTVSYDSVKAYGYSEDELFAVKARLDEWANVLLSKTG